jgi:signal transduction histidine kinase
MPSASRLFWLGATWLPVGMLWYTYALRVRNDPSYAAVAALVMMATLGVLAAVVWTLSGRYPWGSETRDHVVFVLRYLAIGIVLVVGVMNVDAALVAWHDGITLLDSLHRSGGLLAGDMWSYLAFYLVAVVYLLAVSVAYQVRAHQHLAVQRLALAEAEARVAREKLHALRAQLNPHFLFNVLHSVSCLVRDDARAAEKALEHLGEMLRYVLDDAAGDDVELEDEWTFVRHYLALEKLRLADRLHVRTELDPDALECRIPPFTVQILVENAIKHGIAPLTRPGTVQVRARRENASLLIGVSDDGMGLRRDELPGRGGLGLRALRERLQTRYAGRAAFEIDTSPGAGFDVRITLPADALVEATAS